MTSVLQVRGAGPGSRCISELVTVSPYCSLPRGYSPRTADGPPRHVPPTLRGRDALLWQISAAQCSIITGGPKVRDRFICQPEAGSHRAEHRFALRCFSPLCSHRKGLFGSCSCQPWRRHSAFSENRKTLVNLNISSSEYFSKAKHKKPTWPYATPFNTLIFKYSINIVTHRPIARQRLGKQAHNKYATNNRIDPFLRNVRNTRTQQHKRCRRRCFLCRFTYIQCYATDVFSLPWSDPSPTVSRNVTLILTLNWQLKRRKRKCQSYMCQSVHY
jgi:hypothetical protein